MSRPLRIAMLTHSTNPRGGVVHSMHLAEALCDLGAEVTLFAPDAKGGGFFRTPCCAADPFPVERAASDMTAMVEQRIGDYVRYFEPAANRQFDVFHAHDGISGNALATLKERGLISRCVRTVHHVDTFHDARLTGLQARAIEAADRCLAVSHLWADYLQRLWGIAAALSGNGVDCQRFFPAPGGSAEKSACAHLRWRLQLDEGPIFLAVGGVEERKNTARILEAFVDVHRLRPQAQLVIAGGASLLDHHTYQEKFKALMAQAGPAATRVHRTGPLPDADMPALYRMADTLVFASLKEGFGLCVLEAMASGIPAIVSSIPPFTEYLGEQDALWCDPSRPSSIAEAMLLSLTPQIRSTLAARGQRVAARHDWRSVAQAALPVYRQLCETAHA